MTELGNELNENQLTIQAMGDPGLETLQQTENTVIDNLMKSMMILFNNQQLLFKLHKQHVEKYHVKG